MKDQNPQAEILNELLSSIGGNENYCANDKKKSNH